MIKQKLSQNLWKILLLISCAMLVPCTIAGFAAYYTARDQATNTVSVGSNTIELIETFEPPEEIAAGVSIVKDVKVANTGTSNCYVRVLVAFSDDEMMQYCDIDWDDKNWTYNSDDGYWYYKEVLNPEESTSSLFTTVTIKEDTPASALKEFDLYVYVESYWSVDESITDYISAWKNFQKNKPQS